MDMVWLAAGVAFFGISYGLAQFFGRLKVED